MTRPSSVAVSANGGAAGWRSTLEGGVAVVERALAGRADGVGVLAGEPHGRIGEKTVTGRHARDQAALLRLPAEAYA